MKQEELKKGQIIYLVDEGSYAEVIEPLTRTGRTRVQIHPCFEKAKVVTADNGAKHIEKVKSSRRMEYRGQNSTYHKMVAISNQSQYLDISGKRYLQEHQIESHIKEITEEEEECVKHGITQAKRVLKKIEEINVYSKCVDVKAAQALHKSVDFLDNSMKKLKNDLF